MKRINLFFVFLLLCIGIVLTGCDGLMKLMNTAPTVTITEADQTIDNGASLTLHAVASDADGDELSYQWYVDEELQPNATEAAFVFSKAPIIETAYTIKIAVSDGIASAENSVTVTVSAPAVTETNQFIGYWTMGDGTSVMLAYALFSDLSAKRANAWGESVESGTYAYDENAGTVIFTFSTDEEYNYQFSPDGTVVTLSDSIGTVVAALTRESTDPESGDIESVPGGSGGITNTAPTVTITEADQTIDNGASLTLHAVASDADGDELSYQWYVDDAIQIGAISTDYEFSAVPSTEISYVLKVEVSDGIDCSEDSVTITVSAPVEHNRLKRWNATTSQWEELPVTLPPGVVDIQPSEGLTSNQLFAQTDSNEFFLIDVDRSTYTALNAPVLSDCNYFVAEMLDGSIDFIEVFLADGSIKEWDGNASEWQDLVDADNVPVTLPSDTVITSYIELPVVMLSDLSVFLYYEETWQDGGVDAPADTVEIFRHYDSSYKDDEAITVRTGDGSLYIFTDSWENMNITVPPETVQTFSYNEELIVRY